MRFSTAILIMGVGAAMGLAGAYGLVWLIRSTITGVISVPGAVSLVLAVGVIPLAIADVVRTRRDRKRSKRS